MKVVWHMERAFVKEVRAALPAPQPHVNTVATTMRKLVTKGYLAFEDFGTTHRYYAAVSKEAYAKAHLKPALRSLFGNSMKNVVAFFAAEEDLSTEDLKDIIKMIEDQKD